MTTAELRSYERGSVPVPQDVAERLADAYGCDVSTLLPNRNAAPVTLEPGYLRVGAASKTMRSDDPQPDEVLTGYLGLLYDMRSMKPGTRIPLRDPDLDALAEALGGTPDAIETRLIELMHVTRDEAATMTASLLRRKLVVPAAGLIFGAGLLTGGVKLTDEHGSQARTAPTSIGAPTTVSRGDVAIGTAATVGRVVDLATIAAAPTRVTPANVTPSPDVVTPPADFVPPPADVSSAAPAVLAAPSNEVAAPADEVIGAPADEFVAPSDDDVTPPADEVIGAPADEFFVPTDDVVPPATDDVTPPPDDAIVPREDAVEPSKEPTQERLSTGMRVNRAQDDAAGLNVRQDQADAERDPADEANQDPQDISQLLR